MDTRAFISLAASRFTRTIVLIIVAMALSGCRLLIIVPLGGQVISLNGIGCTEGETCEVEVDDTNFDETYGVIEDAGYRFTGWARGKNPPHVCGGNSRPCVLTTTSFGGNARLLDILASDDEYALEPVFEGQVPEQKIEMAVGFPQQFIDSNRNQGFFITSVFGDAEGWIVVMTERSKLTRQVYLTDSRFPRDAIMREMNSGLNITSLGFSDDTWVVVMSDSSHRNQRWISRSAFPESEIDDALDNGEYINNIAYGSNGQWIVVFADVPGYQPGEQRYAADIEFDRDFISSMWSESRDISFMTFGLDQWVTVMTGVDGNVNQAWRSRGDVTQITDMLPEWREQRRLISNFFRGGSGVYYASVTEYLDHMQGTNN